MTARKKFCCRRLPSDLSSRWLLLPKQTSLKVQGSRVHGCYYPLPKRQLEWQIRISDVAKQVEKELATFMQASLSNQILANVNA